MKSWAEQVSDAFGGYKREKPRDPVEARLLRERGTPEHLIGPTYTKPGGNMNEREPTGVQQLNALRAKHGFGERDNALRDRIEEYTPSEPLYRSPVDLCVCGTKTRAEHGCLCAEDPGRICGDGYACLAPDCSCPTRPEETILQEADRLTQHPRGKAYGHPYDDFTKVTNMALALWGRGPEKPEEHALYQILVKLARLEATPGHHDSIVDIAGYAKAYSMVIEERVRRLTA